MRSIPILPLFVFLGALSVSQCSLDVPKRRTANLSINLENFLDRSGSRSALGNLAPPNTVTGFDCFVVNVMGEKIVPSAISPNRRTLAQIIAGDYCSYPGVVSRTISGGGGTANVMVPKGGKIVVQVLGIVAPGGCETNLPVVGRFSRAPNTLSDPGYPGIYEVGRRVLDSDADQSVSVSNTYNPDELKEVRCHVQNVDCKLPAVQSGTFGGGDGTSGSPYRICTRTQLVNAGTVAAAHYTLEQNLNLSSEAFTPLFTATAYSGTFNGQGFSIGGFHYATSAVLTSNIGLFGTVTNATIKQLNLMNVDINVPNTTVATGGLIGQANGGTVQDNVVSGTVTGKNQTGGMIGVVNMATINNLEMRSGTVTGLTEVGGIFGSINSGAYADNKGKANVVGNSVVGGAAGLITGSGSLTRSSAAGSVTATGSNVGGFVGRLNSSTFSVTKSFATGNVSVTGGGSDVGGFVGEADTTSSIANCYSQGSVSNSGGGNTGGFAGNIENGSSVSFCYSSTTSISGGSNKGSFVGTLSSGTYQSCVGNSESGLSAIGSGFSSNVFGRTTAQMKTAATYTNFFPVWDFASIWDIGTDFPFLR